MTVTGTLEDNNANPIVDAEVAVEIQGDLVAPATTTAQTAEDGSFLFEVSVATTLTPTVAGVADIGTITVRATGAAIGTDVSGSSNVTVNPGRAATVTLDAPATAIAGDPAFTVTGTVTNSTLAHRLDRFNV